MYCQFRPDTSVASPGKLLAIRHSDGGRSVDPSAGLSSDCLRNSQSDDSAQKLEWVSLGGANPPGAPNPSRIGTGENLLVHTKTVSLVFQKCQSP